MVQNYKKAFKCSKCPQSNGEDGCPCWNEVIMTNTQTGEDRVVKGCNFQILPFLVTESIKASNVASNTAAGMKTEIARGYAVLAQDIPGFVQQLAASVDPDDREPGT